MIPNPSATPAYPRPTGGDKLMAGLCHLSGLLGAPLLLPLIVYLLMNEGSPFVKDQAREALNFHLSLFLYSLACVPLALLLVGIPLLIALGVFSVVVAILATVRCLDGVAYRYPMTIRLVP